MTTVVTAVFVYGFVFRLWMMYVQCTMRFARIGEDFEPVLSFHGYVVFSLVHAAWLVVLIVELLRARRESPPGLRKGHLVGALFGMALVIGLQWTLVSMQDLALTLGF